MASSGACVGVGAEVGVEASVGVELGLVETSDAGLVVGALSGDCWDVARGGAQAISSPNATARQVVIRKRPLLQGAV